MGVSNSQIHSELYISGKKLISNLYDFLSVLHADKKINHDVRVTEQFLDVDGKTVLAFHIAENPRTRKPVYLDGDIRRTFLRKGSGDYKAQVQDIERMLRDATSERWDSQPFERVDIEEAFNPSSLGWYRDRFHAVNDNFDPRRPDLDFLYDWGYVIKKDGKRRLPTRAKRKSAIRPSPWPCAVSPCANRPAAVCA